MRTRFAKIRVVVVSILLLTFLPGCWGQIEVGKIAIVIGIGIDKMEDGQVRVVTQIVNPGGTTGGGSSGGPAGGNMGQERYLNHEAYGKTLTEAVQNFYRQPWRTYFFSHNTIVIFGEAYAKEGIGEAMDYFDRLRDFRRIQMFAVSKGYAKDTLKADVGVETINARGLRELIEHQSNTSETINSIELTVTDQLISPSHSPIVAAISVNDKNEPQNCGIALFHGDKLAGFANPTQARAILWIMGRARRAELDILTNNAGEQANEVAVHVLSTRSRVRTMRTATGPVFKVSLYATAELRQVNEKHIPTPEKLQEWRLDGARYMEDEMKSTLKYLQDINVDAVQFGTTLFNNDARYWREIATKWSDVFPHIKVQYDIKLNIIRTGMTSLPPETDFTPESYPPRYGREAKIH